MIILTTVSIAATHVALVVAFGSSLKKIMVSVKVVAVAITRQVKVFAICLFLLFILMAAKI